MLPNDTPLKIGMSVEVNIIFRENPAAIVVPVEAVAGDTVQVVDNGRIERVPVSIGIRGSRNVEIINGVLRGMAVLSPARTDLADGTRLRIDNSSAKPAAETPAVSDRAPDQDTAGAPGSFVATDADSAVISAAISAGTREYLVRRIFIIESAIIGAVGILFGWIPGYLLCYAWSHITIFNPLTGTTVRLQIYYSPMHYIVAGGISIVCCAGAAFFPARKATRVHPVEIIRGAS